METTTPPPEPQDFGLVARVILIGEKLDGTPLLTQIEADGTTPLNLEFLVREGENPKISQQAFQTQKELLNYLSGRMHYAQLDLKGAPSEPIPKKFTKVYRGEAQ